MRQSAMMVARPMGVGLLSLGLTVAALTTPALAQAPPSFPSAFEREALLAWLGRETDITPERVVAVTPQAVTAVVSNFPAAANQGPRLVIRAEALSPETHARTGALSWHVSMTADCAGHRVRMGETTGYPERNLLGGRRVLRPAESDWRVPDAGTALDNAWRMACDARFLGPFQDPATSISQVDAPASEAAAPLAATSPPAAAEPVKAPPRSHRPPPALTPAPIAPHVGGLAVQIGSFPDKASANAALVALGNGRSHALEQAVVNGRTWYRAVVSGFANASEANDYCARRRAAGGGCLVRGAPRG